FTGECASGVAQRADLFFFSSRRRHTRCYRDWSSDVCSSDLVDPLRPRVADRHDLLLLEKPQQLRLHVERQVANFVEEERTSGGGANEPLLIGDRTGKAAAPVAEQLAVGKVASCRRAVVRKER